MQDIHNIRFLAFREAVESHPLRFNVAEKPTIEDLLERAKKIEEYVTKGEEPF